MIDGPREGMVGPFWIVEDRGRAVLIAHAVLLTEAVPYGNMLTVELGHSEFWSKLACCGGRSLNAGGIPSAPIWSEYEEWPRGRVLYDCLAQVFVIRADRQLLAGPFMRLVTDRFCIPVEGTNVLLDDHYRSARRVSVPGADGSRPGS